MPCGCAGSGVDDPGALLDLGTMYRHCDAGSEANTHAHLERWLLYLMRHNEPLPEQFDRAVVGNTEEEGLAFNFKWPPIKGSTKVLRRRMFA